MIEAKDAYRVIFNQPAFREAIQKVCRATGYGDGCVKEALYLLARRAVETGEDLSSDGVAGRLLLGCDERPPIVRRDRKELRAAQEAVSVLSSGGELNYLIEVFTLGRDKPAGEAKKVAKDLSFNEWKELQRNDVGGEWAGLDTMTPRFISGSMIRPYWAQENHGKGRGLLRDHA